MPECRFYIKKMQFKKQNQTLNTEIKYVFN